MKKEENNYWDMEYQNNPENEENIKILLNVRDENKLSDELRNDSHVTIIKQDVSMPFNISEPVDYIVHAASPASPKIMKDYPKCRMV